MEDIDVSPSGGFSQIYNRVNEQVYNTSNPMVVGLLVSIICLYFLFFNYLGETKVVETPGISLIEITMWGLFLFLVMVNGIQYFYKIDVKTALKNIFTGVPEVDIKIDKDDKLFKQLNKAKKNVAKDLLGPVGKDVIKPVKKLEKELEKDLLGPVLDDKEVFHVSENDYTYKEAKAICKAYDADLATYSQVERAYERGGEWCGYGWSKDQMALYPTQKKTWDYLQKVKGHQHDCGRPGVNGGYIKNPNVRFGVNCYGKKPKITEEEEEIMKNTKPYPLSKDDVEVNKLANKYKKNLDNILLSSFNKKKWSRI